MTTKNKKRISGVQLALFILSAALMAGILILRTTAKLPTDSKMSPEATPAAEMLNVPLSPEPTAEPSPEPTPEPTPEIMTLSFVGDNTLWASKQFENHEVGLPLVVGDNYDYPFENTKQIFENDEMTFANLECSFSDTKLPYDYTLSTFQFLAKPEFAQILVRGGVDFVTMANNHTMDFFQAGVESTQKTLEGINLPYGAENEGHMVESPNGLKIGVWTAGNDMLPNRDKAVQGVKDLRAQGADIVICMFHWGREMYYSPDENQTGLAHACIDAGADIVYGSHPHCLQPIEQYGNGIIMYSMGNWVFGGHTYPSDPDTAIVQIKVKRDIDGSVSLDGFDIIPCCLSSNLEGAEQKATNPNYAAVYNDYKPAIYEEGSAGYERVMSKLKGTFEPASQGRDYSDFYASWG